MKNILLTLAVLGILLTMSYCDDKGMNEDVNPFVGTWERIDNINARIVFTDTVKTVYINNIFNWAGEYVYNETQLIVTIDKEISSAEMVESWGDTFIANYEFNDDLLFLRNPALTTFRKVIE